MEAIMKQVKHPLKQKEEQEASLIRQLEVVKREKEQLQQTIQILSSCSASKEEAANSSTTKQPKEEIQEISSDESQQTMTPNHEEYPPLQADHKNIKKWYVIFNGENKGVYDDWGIASSYILGKNIIHKSYRTKNEAETAYNEAYKAVITDNVKCSKTVLLTPQKSTSSFTPQKPVSIPRSLNQLNAKIALESILSTKEKEAMKKPSAKKFAELWDSLISYTEVHSLMGFYPVARRPGPKAVFLADLSDPMTLWDYFIHGFIDTIYLEGTNLHCVSEFPSAVQTIIRNYKIRFAKQERGLFIKMHSSYPIFDEDSQLIVPSITFANMGISNGSKPTKDDLPRESPTQDHLIFALAGVYLASSRIGNGKDQKSRIRVNYASKTFIIYSLTDSEITPEAMKAIETFEQPFEKFSHQLAELPADSKKQLCKHIMHASRHNCSHCLENTEETPFMED
ncbi:uncharacterized protein LOC122195670 [Lactuca sativa]|jgi:hypothetical protein|uniref:Ribonuclease H1 N-terminal domain-containing protein n=1 Tax=Lactuca sativa TaxID=4236 RepID=A0A9R1UNV6_LACSA|nr:uncharacterized protein LOC122195670 [Lactuca sativa]XP_042753651.1 uncharacterized protein LOC122195670 [Lactuca sativa]KAJ0190846.1 hypothetical protein LSAT_V11C800429000 [Lactuca sativa]